MKLNCIVVDDDRYAQTSLAQCVEITDFLQLVGVYSDAIEAWGALKEQAVDLIFLDVEMPKLSGLEFIESLKEAPQIILVTGKKEYAYDAFEHDVTDFLAKPVQYNRFLKAAEKALKVAESEQEGANGVGEEPEHIFLKSDLELQKVYLSNIQYLEAVGDYVKVHTNEGRLMVLSTLKSFEAKLADKHFTRVHRSYMVNLARIAKVSANEVHVAGNAIPVSRSYKSSLKEKLKLFGS